MTSIYEPKCDAGAGDMQVTVIPAAQVSANVRARWVSLRAENPALWSPYFDIRMFDVLAKHAPNAQLGVVHKHGQIEALLPFQGKRGGLARPLGAPLSDQHSLIAKADCDISLASIIADLGMSGFVFTGLLQPADKTSKQELFNCHVADLSHGLDAYVAWRKANWNDQVKKNERRKRQGERQWGPMRLGKACPTTSDHFETLMTWKQAKYVETNRHNVLAVPWINAFLRALYHSPDPDFGGEITLLYFGDHLAALEFGLRANNVMHSWFPAFNRDYAQVSPGILLMDAMIEDCARRGITKVDLGIGHDQYKRHASNAPVPVWSGTLPVSRLQKFASHGLVHLTTFVENRVSTKAAALIGKLERRSEMILAAEPTFLGRTKGYLAALKAVTNPT
jgi:CelD/BcsL family acetyltransferase involved in cellulose biosynthesis